MSDFVECADNAAAGDTREPPTNSADVEELSKVIAETKASILKKEEQLRKLHMVVTYRQKNRLAPLDGLIVRWRSAVREALVDLRGKLPEPAPAYSEILDRLQIRHSVVGYDEDEDGFP